MKLTKLAQRAAFLLSLGAFVVISGSSAAADTPSYPPLTTTVSGHIYLDTNANGVQDPGEPNLSGVSVVISSSGSAEPCTASVPQRLDTPQAVVCPTQTVITDANGNWTAQVLPGSTTADVDETTLPPGVLQTEGTDPTTIIAVLGTNNDGGTDGYTPSATVYGHIYLDTNANGTQDPGEPDLPGVQVIVKDSAGNTQTVTTDANGDWVAAVRAGLTTATVVANTLPPGLKQTEGTGSATVTAIAGQSVFVGNNGYTRANIVGTGSNTTRPGSWLALGFVALGAALMTIARSRRRQPALA